MIQTWLKVRYAPGEPVAVKLFGQKEYGRDGRTVTGDFQVPADDPLLAELGATLAAIADKYGWQVAYVAEVAAARAFVAAVDRGEG